ncbi:MAG: SRPBCC family protein [Phenylobacterium sp.]|uniref:SRPBCC family protein n=1 Tax=Phenylobacterium sp. TaxID=1871053 RepID=UPI001A532FA2|nr:SRPBCC family protein [Phenylobacterium sp.]MBL8553230.1 SRPBCC family protein [Phenylobacterium sp.]
MTNDDLGEIRRTGDTVEITFVRRLNRPIEKAWAAITVPERIADWFAEVVRLELRLGGAIHLRFPEVNFDIRGVITEYDAPRRLTWTWPQPDGSESAVSFALEPDGDGCRLTLVERGLTLSQGAGNAAGWHAHLEALEDACDGVRTSWATLLEREKRVNQTYKDLAPG